MAEPTVRTIAPARGKLGVLCVGLGAVASTFIAGVELTRRGKAKPFGSLTQMATIRLGKRTEQRAPLIKDFVPLAGLEDLHFGAWDPIPDNAYEAALKCGVLDKHDHVEVIRDFLAKIAPMPAVFDQHYVKRLQGSNVKPGKNKREWAETSRRSDGCGMMNDELKARRLQFIIHHSAFIICFSLSAAHTARRIRGTRA